MVEETTVVKGKLAPGEKCLLERKSSSRWKKRDREEPNVEKSSVVGKVYGKKRVVETEDKEKPKCKKGVEKVVSEAKKKSKVVEKKRHKNTLRTEVSKSNRRRGRVVRS